MSSDSHNMGKIADETGYCAIWDVSNGLTPIWLCPSCTARVRPAWAVIVETAKTERLGLAGFLKRTGKEET